MKYYTGIGARQTPKEIQIIMSKVAAKLQSKGWFLRTGATEGADKAFSDGVTNPIMKDHYLPWKMFQQNPSTKHKLDPGAFQIAKGLHPNWSACTPAVQKMHAATVHQLLGEDFSTPSVFMICWTPNGEPIGGTGLAILVANHYKIPVFNLAILKDLTRLAVFLEK